MLPGQAGGGGAAAAGSVLVARHARVVEVIAACPLQQVAAVAGHVADLRRGAGKNGGAQQRIVLAHQRVPGRVLVACQGAEPETAVGGGCDVMQRQAVDVDEQRRSHDPLLHQVDEIGAARDELRAAVRAGCLAGCGGNCCERLVNGRDRPVVERVHAGFVATRRSCSTCATASVIWG